MVRRFIHTSALFISVTSLFAVSAMPAFASNARLATAPRLDSLVCFAGPTDNSVYGGACSVQANSASGPATLDNTDSNSNGDYSGINNLNSTLQGKRLGNVNQLSYSYTGTTTPTPGDLSLNLPLDTDGNGTSDTYAFIDATYCGGTSGNVDVIHDSNCGIYVNNFEYPNWAAFVAANPSWTIGPDGSQPFIIAERTPSEGPASWTVSNITLGPPLMPVNVFYGGPASIKHGHTATLIVYLATTGGSAISGRSITISLGKGSHQQSCRTGKTNSSGQAHCVIGDVQAKPGTRTVTMTFAGDTPGNHFVYLSATATHTVNIT